MTPKEAELEARIERLEILVREVLVQVPVQNNHLIAELANQARQDIDWESLDKRN